MINLIYTVLPTITLIVGFYIGFSINKEDKLPEIKSPIKIIKEKQEQKEKAQEIKALETYMENIDNYPDNQKDIKE